MTDFIYDDDYEEMASSFQLMMINWLNLALEKAGVADKEKRKEINAEFGFMFSIWKDQYWFSLPNGKRVYPCIAFATKGPVADMQMIDLGVVYIPTAGFSFQEYYSGNMYCLYEESNEDVSGKIQMGIE